MSNLWLSPNAWDATRLRTLFLCKRRFYYEQIKQLRNLRDGFQVNLEFGNAWHEAIRSYDTARITGGTNPLETSIRRAIEITKDWPKETGSSQKNVSTLVRALIWYEEKFGDNPLVPLFHNGTPCFELGFNLPLFPERSEAKNAPTLCGNLDGIVEFGGEIWILERKSTATALSGFYWNKFDPNIQVDVYCLAAHLLWPEWKVQGVMVEAFQTGATFARFERRLFRRRPGRLEETLAQIQREVGQIEGQPEAEFEAEPNFASCMIDNGCPYRTICTSDPSMRQWAISSQFAPRSDPWDPLNKEVK